MTETKTSFPTDKDKERFKSEVTLISAEGIVVNEMPDGRLTALQKVDGINLGSLNELVMTSGQKVPHEVAFRLGTQEHRVMSTYGRAKIVSDLLGEAQGAGIEVTGRIGIEDTEEYPWLHVQYVGGKMVGAETIGPSLLRNFELHEGQPMVSGQEPVKDLHVFYYEGEDRAQPVGQKTSHEYVPGDPAHQAGQIIGGIASGLAGLGDAFREDRAAWRARAEELGIPVSQLPLDEMNRILKENKRKRSLGSS